MNNRHSIYIDEWIRFHTFVFLSCNLAIGVLWMFRGEPLTWFYSSPTSIASSSFWWWWWWWCWLGAYLSWRLISSQRGVSHVFVASSSSSFLSSIAIHLLPIFSGGEEQKKKIGRAGTSKDHTDCKRLTIPNFFFFEFPPRPSIPGPPTSTRCPRRSDLLERYMGFAHVPQWTRTTSTIPALECARLARWQGRKRALIRKTWSSN